MKNGHLLQSLILCVLISLCVERCFAVESQHLEDTLDRLSAAIKTAGFKRVGVVPSFEQVSGNDRARVALVSSTHGLFFSDTVQIGLIRRCHDDYEVVDEELLMYALQDAGINGTKDLEKLEGVAEKVNGLDAIVTGSFEVRESLPDGLLPVNDIRLKCRLLDIKQGTDKEITTNERRMTLADAIYNGQSIEVMRWTRQGIIPIGFSGMFVLHGNADLPLNPDASEHHFDFFQPHPLPNPDCPYRIAIKVNGTTRGLVYHPRLDDVYVPLEPGEEFQIVLTNKSVRQINVAVFIDGINVLGKKRELPNAGCMFWTMQADTAGEFRGYCTEDQDGAVVSPFRVVPVDDSVAMRQQLTEHLGLITVVVFDNGWPSQRQFRRPRHKGYRVSRSWNDTLAKWEYEEGWQEITGAAPPGAPRFAIGAGEARPTNLTRTQAKKGPIMAAMTIRYATNSEIEKIISAHE